MDFLSDSVVTLAGMVRSGEVSARELVDHAFTRIDASNSTVNAFVALDREGAMAEAAALDERQARGEEVGALAGIPLGVKDLEDAAGLPTTRGSHALTADDCAVSDSTLVSRLKMAGAIVVGKTNTPECGWTAQTFNPRFGTTRNPWNLDRTPGGSSGGSAAAIAAGMVPLATGSDGGGSLRIPSALCGLSGFKPSLGRVPSGGPHPPDWTILSSKGTMAWRTSDIAASLDTVIGPDPTDLRSLPTPDASWVGALDAPGFPLQAVWSPTLGYGRVDAEVLEVCERGIAVLAELGVEVDQRDDIFDADPAVDWLRLEAGYLTRTFDPIRRTPAWERVTLELRALIESFAPSSSLEFIRAEDACHALNLRLVEVFHRARLLICPTVAGQTPVCGAQGMVDGAATPTWVSFTYPFNMTRSPAGTVCVGRTRDGLPVGLQLIGPQHGDVVVLRAMAALEAAMGFSDRPTVDALS
ncbi:MAG: amidase [Acidimicrobiales bacterium]